MEVSFFALFAVFVIGIQIYPWLFSREAIVKR